MKAMSNVPSNRTTPDSQLTCLGYLKIAAIRYTRIACSPMRMIIAFEP